MTMTTTATATATVALSNCMSVLGSMSGFDFCCSLHLFLVGEFIIRVAAKLN